MLPAARAGEGFESVARRHGQLAEIPDAVELGELPPDHGPEILRAGGAGAATIDPVEQVLGSCVRERAYHAMYYNG